MLFADLLSLHLVTFFILVLFAHCKYVDSSANSGNILVWSESLAVQWKKSPQLQQVRDTNLEQSTSSMAAWIEATHQSIPFMNWKLYVWYHNSSLLSLLWSFVVGSFHNGLYPIGYVGIALWCVTKLAMPT